MSDVHDPEYESLKKKRLSVVGHDEPPPADQSILNDEGLAPGEGAPDVERVHDDIVATLRTVHDPEIPVNIYELGLIYGLDISKEGEVHVKMTLTAPACPVAGALVREVHDKTRAVPGVRRVRTELVWDPPWTPDKLSMEARLELGML